MLETDAESSGAAVGAQGPARVLVAVDEANIAVALEFILSRAGYEVRMASDGESALDAVRRDAPDLMVLDVMLPQLSGFEVLKLVRADPKTAELPVLVLTARGQQQDRHTAEQIGASAFLTKPFSNSELIECVKRLKRP